jgi:hypothetical protein
MNPTAAAPTSKPDIAENFADESSMTGSRWMAWRRCGERGKPSWPIYIYMEAGDAQRHLLTGFDIVCFEASAQNNGCIRTELYLHPLRNTQAYMHFGRSSSAIVEYYPSTRFGRRYM